MSQIPVFYEFLVLVYAKAKPTGTRPAGPEFGDRQGHLMRVDKALYGLKSSGARWHDRLADVLRDMGFTPSKADDTGRCNSRPGV